MKINKIVLYNFNSYEGLNEFDFTCENNSKNIILIGGKNGAGKTSLFTAIKIALYGPLSFGYVDYLTLTVIANAVQINILTKQQELARTTAEDESGIKFLCTTVHKAKGLEYGTVILPFTGQAIDNLQKANTDVNYSSPKLAYSIKVDENKKDCNSNYDSQQEIGQRICEEARILYVALTRAIRNCIWMKDADKKSNMSWSKFLEV